MRQGAKPISKPGFMTNWVGMAGTDSEGKGVDEIARLGDGVGVGEGDEVGIAIGDDELGTGMSEDAGEEDGAGLELGADSGEGVAETLELISAEADELDDDTAAEDDDDGCADEVAEGTMLDAGDDDIVGATMLDTEVDAPLEVCAERDDVLMVESVVARLLRVDDRVLDRLEDEAELQRPYLV